MKLGFIKDIDYQKNILKLNYLNITEINKSSSFEIFQIFKKRS
jgi:hypothetical protein